MNLRFSFDSATNENDAIRKLRGRDDYHLVLVLSGMLSVKTETVNSRFAAFGAGESTSLHIYREDVSNKKDDDLGDDSDDDGRKQKIWSMSASNLNTARPEWTAGQVAVNSGSDFRLILEGKASNGGFAIDQLVFTSGTCKSKSNFSKGFKRREAQTVLLRNFENGLS